MADPHDDFSSEKLLHQVCSYILERANCVDLNRCQPYLELARKLFVPTTDHHRVLKLLQQAVLEGPDDADSPLCELQRWLDRSVAIQSFQRMDGLSHVINDVALLNTRLQRVGGEIHRLEIAYPNIDLNSLCSRFDAWLCPQPLTEPVEPRAEAEPEPQEVQEPEPALESPPIECPKDPLCEIVEEYPPESLIAKMSELLERALETPPMSVCNSGLECTLERCQIECSKDPSCEIEREISFVSFGAQKSEFSQKTVTLSKSECKLECAQENVTTKEVQSGSFSIQKSKLSQRSVRIQSKCERENEPESAPCKNESSKDQSTEIKQEVSVQKSEVSHRTVTLSTAECGNGTESAERARWSTNNYLRICRPCPPEVETSDSSRILTNCSRDEAIECGNNRLRLVVSEVCQAEEGACPNQRIQRTDYLDLPCNPNVLRENIFQNCCTPKPQSDKASRKLDEGLKNVCLCLNKVISGMTNDEINDTSLFCDIRKNYVRFKLGQVKPYTFVCRVSFDECKRDEKKSQVCSIRYELENKDFSIPSANEIGNKSTNPKQFKEDTSSRLLCPEEICCVTPFADENLISSNVKDSFTTKNNAQDKQTSCCCVNIGEELKSNSKHFGNDYKRTCYLCKLEKMNENSKFSSSSSSPPECEGNSAIKEASFSSNSDRDCESREEECWICVAEERMKNCENSFRSLSEYKENRILCPFYSYRPNSEGPCSGVEKMYDNRKTEDCYEQDRNKSTQEIGRRDCKTVKYVDCGSQWVEISIHESTRTSCERNQSSRTKGKNGQFDLCRPSSEASCSRVGNEKKRREICEINRKTEDCHKQEKNKNTTETDLCKFLAEKTGKTNKAESCASMFDEKNKRSVWKSKCDEKFKESANNVNNTRGVCCPYKPDRKKDAKASCLEPIEERCDETASQVCGSNGEINKYVGYQCEGIERKSAKTNCEQEEYSRCEGKSSEDPFSEMENKKKQRERCEIDRKTRDTNKQCKNKNTTKNGCLCKSEVENEVEHCSLVCDKIDKRDMAESDCDEKCEESTNDISSVRVICCPSKPRRKKVARVWYCEPIAEEFDEIMPLTCNSEARENEDVDCRTNNDECSRPVGEDCRNVGTMTEEFVVECRCSVKPSKDESCGTNGKYTKNPEKLDDTPVCCCLKKETIDSQCPSNERIEEKSVTCREIGNNTESIVESTTVCTQTRAEKKCGKLKENSTQSVFKGVQFCLCGKKNAEEIEIGNVRLDNRCELTKETLTEEKVTQLELRTKIPGRNQTRSPRAEPACVCPSTNDFSDIKSKIQGIIELNEELREKFLATKSAKKYSSVSIQAKIEIKSSLISVESSVTSGCSSSSSPVPSTPELGNDCILDSDVRVCNDALCRYQAPARRPRTAYRLVHENHMFSMRVSGSSCGSLPCRGGGDYFEKPRPPPRPKRKCNCPGRLNFLNFVSSSLTEDALDKLKRLLKCILRKLLENGKRLSRVCRNLAKSGCRCHEHPYDYHVNTHGSDCVICEFERSRRLGGGSDRRNPESLGPRRRQPRWRPPTKGRSLDQMDNRYKRIDTYTSKWHASKNVRETRCYSLPVSRDRGCS